MCFPIVSFLHVDLVPTVGMTAILMSAAGLPVHLTRVPQAASTHKATKKHSSVKEGRKVSKKGSSCSNSDVCFHLLFFISLPPSFPFVSPPHPLGSSGLIDDVHPSEGRSRACLL